MIKQKYDTDFVLRTFDLGLSVRNAKKKEKSKKTHSRPKTVGFKEQKKERTFLTKKKK